MIVDCTAVIVHVCRDQVSGGGFDGVDEITHEKRVTEIQADAEIRQVQIVFDHLHQRLGRRQVVGNHLERKADAQRLRDRVNLLDAAPGLVPVVVGSRRILGGGQAQVHDQVVVRHRSRNLHGRDGFLHGQLTRGKVGRGIRVSRPPAGADHALDNWGMDRVQPHAGRVEPPAEIRNRCGMVVVEVAARGKQLDPVETVLGHVAEMLLAEPMAVKEVGRDAELHRTEFPVEHSN